MYLTLKWCEDLSALSLFEPCAPGRSTKPNRSVGGEARLECYTLVLQLGGYAFVLVKSDLFIYSLVEN